MPDFDRLYGEEGDPWRVGDSWYEQRKLSVVLASLHEREYARALDPACGTGHLATLLAQRCGQVVARDASPGAIAVARGICEASGNVDVGVCSLPYRDASESVVVDVPDGTFDLIVLSEVLYYFDEALLIGVLDSVLDRAASRFELVLVHWRDRPDDGVLPGDEVHAIARKILKHRGLRHQVAHFDEEFVLDIFTVGHDHHLD